jgi:hypothetical protein
MTTRSILAASILLLAPLTAAAQTLDWPATVVCTLFDPTICTPDDCHQAALDTLDFPRLIRLDLEEGVMHAVTPEHAGRQSHFKVIDSSKARIVMQGFENGRAFSGVLDEPGTLSLSAAVDGTTFSVFGRCTDLKLIIEAGE